MPSDITWTPPRDEGLRHERGLLESLLTVAPPGVEPTDPGVYAILLSTPDTDSVETYERLWRKQHDAVPTVDDDGYSPETLAEADRIVYVGAAKNVRERVAEHVAGERPSAVSEVFPVHSVWGVWWCDSAEEAFERESARAIDLNNRFGPVYFHSR